MKINAISSFGNNFVSKRNSKINLNHCVQQPHFEGILDVFKKQKDKSPEQKDSDEINDILKGAINGDKALAKCGIAFFTQLNELLRMGVKKNYKGYFNFVDTKSRRKNVTYGDIDENLGIPSIINIWENGTLNSVYEIYSVSPQPIFHVTNYKKDSETQYNFIGKRALGFFSIDKDGLIVKQFPSDHGVYQQQARKINDQEAALLYELYWDYKHPESSHFIQNSQTDAIEYGYDKKRKFWYVKRVIPEADKENVATYEG